MPEVDDIREQVQTCCINYLPVTESTSSGICVKHSAPLHITNVMTTKIYVRFTAIFVDATG